LLFSRRQDDQPSRAPYPRETLAVDLMVFGGVAVTLGAGEPIALAASIPLGVITYLAQKKWYGDDNENALLKGLLSPFLPPYRQRYRVI
jgi:hypothetical protein